MNTKDESIESLQKELAYYKKQLDRLSGKTIGNQYNFAQLSNISKKYISGFKIMADLQRTFSFYAIKELLFEEFMDGIFSQLFLDRVILLQLTASNKMQSVSNRGFTPTEKEIIDTVELDIPNEFLENKQSFLINSTINLSQFESLVQTNLLTQNFIFLPLIKSQQVWGALFVGMHNVFKPLSYLTFSPSNIDMFESLAGIISAMTLQLEQREMMEKERNRIARDMHDDIGSELSKISVTCGALKKQFGTDGNLIKDLETIKSATESIVNNIGNIIWALNPVNNTAENLLAYVREYAYDFLELHNIKITFSFNSDIQTYSLAHEIRTHIFMVIKEALHNIVKHAHASSVHININIEANKFYCSITDNGDGMAAHKNNFGNGLRNMKQRITEIGGVLQIESAPHKGTCLTMDVRI